MAEKKMLHYETLFALSTKNGEEATAALKDKFTKLIADNGTVESVDDWGTRKLAYEIEDETVADYVLVNFVSGPDFPAELDRIFGITEGVLRSMIVSKEDK